MKYMKMIDSFLNSITMYRLMVYVLIAEIAVATVLGFFGLVPFSGWSIALSAGFLYAVSEIVNRIFSKIFKAVPNNESATITALILALVLAPATSVQDYIILLLASVLAMASKYILAVNKKHIFNPAAIALLILDLMGIGAAVWWVGSAVLIPVTLIGGLLVVKKIRRFSLFNAFLLASLISISIFGILNGNQLTLVYKTMFSSWPIFFFGTIMLTEPSTTPPNRISQIIYGSLIGFLFGASFHFGPFFSTPELALVLGNIYSFLMGLKFKLILSFKEKVKIAPDIYEFVFEPDRKLNFAAGQYMEWTVPPKDSDDRGNRRYFTISSSPNQKDIRVVFRHDNERPSSFKKNLMDMKTGDKMTAGQLSGEFILPEDKHKKVVLIAGGVGITPFVSMARQMVDQKIKRDIVLVFTSKNKDDFIFTELFKEAGKYGLSTKYVITEPDNINGKWDGEVGRLNTEMLSKLVPDYTERTFYVSGPNGLVDAIRDTLKKLGIGYDQVITDYFPGY